MKIEFLPYYIDSLKPLKGHTFSGFFMDFIYIKHKFFDKLTKYLQLLYFILTKGM